MEKTITPLTIPQEVRAVVETLQQGGFEAFLVGGCVRDLLMERVPRDWDITTNAAPEDIQGLFPDSFYENEFGTVGIKTGSADETLAVIEATPYRKESTYSDHRHPDTVVWSDSLDEDLARRDFTINAIAYEPSKGHLIDPHKGHSDIKDKTIRAVGEAKARFAEDALRMLRAIRLATEISFSVSRETLEAIEQNAALLGDISRERIRDEFFRIILSNSPSSGITLLERLGLLSYIAPELEKGIGVDQNQAHSYGVFEHLLRALQASADKNFSLEVRLAALFHDIAKPHTREWSKERKDWSFHGHEVVGARIAKKTLENLHVSRETLEKTVKLVRWHMFFSDTEQITLTAVRRMIARVGREDMKDLLNLRVCDRIGMGRPKEEPYRFRKYKAMIEEVERDPVSVGMLALKGDRLMEISEEKPGPRIGWILHALLEEVLDDPKKNIAEGLEKRALALSNLSDNELKTLGEKGREKQEEQEEEEIKKIRSKHHVR